MRYACAASCTSAAMPRSSPTFAASVASPPPSTYSSTSGFTPLRTICGTAAAISSTDANGTSTVALCCGRG